MCSGGMGIIGGGEDMRLLVDSDACPVRKQIEEVAMKCGVRVLFYTNDSQRIRVNYGRVITVATYPDSTDEALVKRCGRGDVVITQDYGLAEICLYRGAYVLHYNGWQYTEEKIQAKEKGKAKIRGGLNSFVFEKKLEKLLRKLRDPLQIM